MPLQVVTVGNDPCGAEDVLKTEGCLPCTCQLAAAARGCAAGEAAALTHKADILVLHGGLLAQGGLAMLARLRRALPNAAFLLYVEPRWLAQACEAARHGAVTLVASGGDMPDALRGAAQGILCRRKKERQADEACRRAYLMHMLTNDAGRASAGEAAAEPRGLRLEAFYFVVVQPRAMDAPPPAPNAMDAALRSLGLDMVTLFLYDAAVLLVMRGAADAGWQAEADAAANRVAACYGRPVRIGISGLGKGRAALRPVYQQARSALWDIALCGQARDRKFYQSDGEQGGGRTLEVHRRLEHLIDSAELTDQSADRAAAAILELSGGQYSHLRAIVSLYAMALCRKFASPTGDTAAAAMHEAWFVGNGQDVRACLRRIGAALHAAQSAQTDGLSLLTRNALWYIRLHAAQGPSLSDAAAQLHVSANYLSALIRRETGETFHDHIRGVRMDMARDLLADPRVSVAEVAQAVGYANYISFFQVFKRSENMTPTAYRQQKGRYVTLAESTV